jgi:phosphoserine phosphatase RsbU/P
MSPKPPEPPETNDRARPERDERDERSRLRAVGARENALGARETGMRVRESAAGERETSLSEREDIASLRAEALRAREEAREAMESRERLLAQAREANEKLLVATVRAEQAADEANAARAKIARSEARFRSLVTTSSAVVWYADAEGRILVDPDSWLRFTGTSPKDVEGDQPGGGWLRAVHPDDREAVREAWARATAMRTPYTHQHRLRRHDGSYAWVLSHAVLIPASGEVEEWIGMMSDISDRIRMDEARERFIGILGHDLRNPLAAIRVGVDSLERADLPERAKKVIARVGRAAQRMSAMIDDVLDFARGRLGGGIPISPERCDLGQICAEEVDQMKHAHPERDISIQASGDLVGTWDASRLEQVLSNLIGNAIQHGADPIRVAAAGSVHEVTLSVQNHGPPIPSSMLARLFDPFQRRAEDHHHGGLGLGLYIASEIVRAHAGTISASSSEHTGTIFTIKLPREMPGARSSWPPTA